MDQLSMANSHTGAGAGAGADSEFELLLSQLGLRNESATRESRVSANLITKDGITVRFQQLKNDYVGVELWIADVSHYLGPVRSAVLDVLLQMNSLALGGHGLSAGVDSRNLVVVYARQPLADLNHTDPLVHYAQWLTYARKLKGLVETLGVQGFDFHATVKKPQSIDEEIALW